MLLSFDEFCLAIFMAQKLVFRPFGALDGQKSVYIATKIKVSVFDQIGGSITFTILEENAELMHDKLLQVTLS